MRLRTLLISSFVLFEVARPGTAQQRPLADEVLVGTQSAELSTRIRTIETLSKVVQDRGSQQVLADPQIQGALFDLLQLENALTVRLFQDGRGVSGVYGEGYGEYYAEVLNLAVGVVPLLNPQQQQLWLRELARGSYNPDSKFAEWLAGYGDLIIDALVEQTRSAEIEPNRSNAYAVLTDMVGFTAFSPQASKPYEHSLSFMNRQRALTVVNEGLNHKDRNISREVVWRFKRHPSPEMLILLQNFLKTQRGRPGFARRADGPQSLEEEVEKAIDQMQAALGQRR